MTATRGGAVILPSTKAALLCAAAFLLAVRPPPSAAALWLTVPPSGSKCVSEDIQVGVVSLADYSVVHENEAQDTNTVSVKVTSPTGHILHHKENATAGQFGFTTTEPGIYLVCFWLEGASKGLGASISLNWKIGFAAEDIASIAKKENITGIEDSLRRLGIYIGMIHHNLLYMQGREEERMDLDERTNLRVAMFSMMSVGICVLSSGLQTWYLNRYFEKKKLI